MTLRGEVLPLVTRETRAGTRSGAARCTGPYARQNTKRQQQTARLGRLAEAVCGSAAHALPRRTALGGNPGVSTRPATAAGDLPYSCGSILWLGRCSFVSSTVWTARCFTADSDALRHILNYIFIYKPYAHIDISIDFFTMTLGILDPGK
jgi:hypothetical protein